MWLTSSILTTKTTMPESSPPPLILTLKLDAKSFDFFNQLRQQYFPPERNFLPAHITLFHALPNTQLEEIRQSLEEYANQTPPLFLTFPKLRFLGRGVAIEVDCPELIQLRQQLVDRWHHHLTRQDQQRYQPHITIQNKVPPDEARQVYEQLAKDWQPRTGCGEALLLWYYRGGPWELIEEFAFDFSNE
jgi:2'-5' RNA ligase